MFFCFFFSSRRRHTRCALVTGVQTCALPIYGRGGAAETVHREERALLDSPLSPAAYWDVAVRAKKRKELRRQANRLAEQGAVTIRHWRAGEALDAWVDAFLDLEARGWKGRAGSAPASHGETEAWFRDRKSVGWGKGVSGGVDRGGRRVSKKK